jgi:hypothetical protein
MTKPPNIEFRVGESETLICDACGRWIKDDDAVIHVNEAWEFGGSGLRITHNGICQQVPDANNYRQRKE